MKLNNRGFAISSIMYIILVLALIFITAILGLLSSRKLILDKVKNTAISEINDNLSNIRYKIGDTFTLLDEQYYVIGVGTDYVTGIKAEPLTVEEVNTYGTNHINRYTSNSTGTGYDMNGYGAVAYYTSDTCGYVNGSFVTTGCTTYYMASEIKAIIENWGSNFEDLKEVNGYSKRLIKQEELVDLGYELGEVTPSDQGYIKTDSTPTWLYNNNYAYWTMTSNNDSSTSMWLIDEYGNFVNEANYSVVGVVRPVINVYKSALD